MGVGADVELLNTHVFGKVKFGYESLILCLIICSFETAVYSLLDEIPFEEGQGEANASSIGVARSVDFERPLGIGALCQVEELFVSLRSDIRSEVCDEVRQYLRLESGAWLEGDVVLAEFDGPFGQLTGELRLV